MTTRSTAVRNNVPNYHGVAAARPALVGVFRLLCLSLGRATAAPLAASAVFFHQREHNDGDDPDRPGTPMWLYFVASSVLVLLGGAFAGLTIALMGQDSIYLQVLSSDKDEPQHSNARRVLKLLQAGKHWVLVTLLLSNVIVNESLPVVLDRCLGGGIAAVVGSTVLIVIFGEVVPQSVCVRYGLQIGGYMSKPVLLLMWLTSPVSWPMAKLLDWVLGEDHGTVYKKSGLKTLVTLHRSLGVASERLNKDEVTIISAVLDLKDKPVAAVMTPMEDVFVMSEETVLDEQTMNIILSAGYSRIPIHEAGNPTNFLGMLLVKILITYDPEDCLRVKDFQLATLPETRPETSCLDIVNYFQEGKSHMVLVSESPGSPHGAIGVVTLEDVIEELIGEEIVDESDVYIDVHKAIRRLHPAPNAQIFRRQSLGPPTVPPSADPSARGENGNSFAPTHLKPMSEPIGGISPLPDATPALLSSSPKTATFLMRRPSAGVDGKMMSSPVPVRHNFSELKEHLKHLGPSNPATNPKNTRLSTVTIKPGTAGGGSPHPRSGPVPGEVVHETIPESAKTALRVPHEANDDEDGDERTSLLRPKSPLGVPKDGVQALRQSYGAASASEIQQRISHAGSHAGSQPRSNLAAWSTSDALATQKTAHSLQSDQATQIPTPGSSSNNLPLGGSFVGSRITGNLITDPSALVSRGAAAAGGSETGSSPASEGRGSRPTTPPARRSTTARSGSITENVFESRGFRKVVLETTMPTEEHAIEGDAGRRLLGPGRDRSGTLGSGRVSDVEEEDDDEGTHDSDDEDASDGGRRAAMATVGSGSSGGGQQQPQHKRKNRRKKRKGKS